MLSVKVCLSISGRSPHGERGLKYWVTWLMWLVGVGRSPHGERGLKSEVSFPLTARARSLSSWRAWIEILASQAYTRLWRVALLMVSLD